MPKWTVYRKATGELLRHFEGPPGSQFLNYGDDEAIVDGERDLRRQ